MPVADIGGQAVQQVHFGDGHFLFRSEVPTLPRVRSVLGSVHQILMR